MIKMLISTSYNSKQYLKGETYTIDEITEKRWIKNGIAKKEQDEFRNEFDDFFPDFKSMTDEELGNYAHDNGIDISQAKTRASAIRMLKK